MKIEVQSSWRLCGVFLKLTHEVLKTPGMSLAEGFSEKRHRYPSSRMMLGLLSSRRIHKKVLGPYGRFLSREQTSFVDNHSNKVSFDMSIERS